MTEDASTAEVVVELTRRLLRSIAEGDWKTYEELCDPTISGLRAGIARAIGRGDGLSPLLLRPRRHPRRLQHHPVLAARPPLGDDAPWSATCGSCRCRTTPASRSSIASRRRGCGSGSRRAGGTSTFIARTAADASRRVATLLKRISPPQRTQKSAEVQRDDLPSLRLASSAVSSGTDSRRRHLPVPRTPLLTVPRGRSCRRLG